MIMNVHERSFVGRFTKVHVDQNCNHITIRKKNTAAFCRILISNIAFFVNPLTKSKLQTKIIRIFVSEIIEKIKLIN
jgi:hypothetical protein